MGRALYSATYGFKAPGIRVEPDPISPNPDKWSIYNRFDPDSDEFFEDAEYEAFMDQGPIDPLPVAVEDSSSSSEESSDSGRDSPMLDRDSPIIERNGPIIDLSSAPVRMSTIWDRLVDGSASEPPADDELLADIPGYTRADRDAFVTVHAPDNDRPRAVPIAIHPPSALRNSTTATDLARATVPASAALSPRRISISIPREPSTSSPASPSTPPAVYTHLQMMTPSPPPTVTPRIYMWGARTHVPASPGSPSVRHTHPAGPLTPRLSSRRRAQNV